MQFTREDMQQRVKFRCERKFIVNSDMVLREFTVKVSDFFFKLMRLAQIHQFAVD